MLLSGPLIRQYVARGDVTIDPFDPECCGPNSYDVHLGREIRTYTMPYYGPDTGIVPADQPLLDARRANDTIGFQIDDDGIVLYPGILYLAHTVERAGSSKYAPMITGRSSVGRLGIEVHQTAGFGDVGFCAQWTLEITVVHPVKVYAGMRIGQLYFEEVVGELLQYRDRPGSKYADQTGATPSLLHKDGETPEA